MKKAISVLTWLLLGLAMLYPAGRIITAWLGYSFELESISAFAVVIAVFSVSIIILDHIFIGIFESKVMGILSAVIAPISLINAVLYIFESPELWVTASVLLSAFCCCYLTFEYGKPIPLKIISLGLSSLIILFILFSGYIALVFGNIAQNTVVKTVESPDGRYYAQVIDSDQGALGGDTFVDVHQIGFDAFLFKIEKKPRRVYFGDWGESEHMQIYWKDDNCLVINSVEYEIE